MRHGPWKQGTNIKYPYLSCPHCGKQTLSLLVRVVSFRKRKFTCHHCHQTYRIPFWCTSFQIISALFWMLNSVYFGLFNAIEEYAVIPIVLSSYIVSIFIGTGLAFVAPLQKAD